jgi:ssRNA-specific RNase YbeY (16S rRNA maturation enzyme)
LCDLRPDGAYVAREDVTVRFSDSEKVVAVNNQWLTSGQVTDAEISFGSGTAKWRIDRNSAEAYLIDASGKLLFAGSCVAKPSR